MSLPFGNNLLATRFACFSLDLARFERTDPFRRCYGSVYTHEHVQIERSRRGNSVNWCNFQASVCTGLIFLIVASMLKAFVCSFNSWCSFSANGCGWTDAIWARLGGRRNFSHHRYRRTSFRRRLKCGWNGAAKDWGG